MPYQQAIFANGEFYHIYNRGVERRTVFLGDRDCYRFWQTLNYYRFKHPPAKFSARNRPSLAKLSQDTSQQVEIVCFCLMPNHFHLLVRQVDEVGITKFMSRVLNSYSKYFNTKHSRVGPLFQGVFKAKRVENDAQLLHLSRYIHLNPLIDYLVKDLMFYKYSSYPEFLNQKSGFCTKQYVLEHFPGTRNYAQFVLDQEDYGRSIKQMERLLVEESET